MADRARMASGAGERESATRRTPARVGTPPPALCVPGQVVGSPTDVQGTFSGAMGLVLGVRRLIIFMALVLLVVAPASAAAATRTVIIGDSIALGSSSTTSAATVEGARTYFTHFLLQSGGHATYLYNAGVRADTSSQQLARYKADVLDKHPDLIILQAPTTDWGRGVPFATTQSNVESMVMQGQDAGALVVIANMLPRWNGHPAIAQMNTWLSSYTSANGIPLLDNYSHVVDPATGSMQSRYVMSDGLHPNAAGAAVIGGYDAQQLAPLLDDIPAYISTVNQDPLNLVKNGLFTADRNKDGKPDNWYEPPITSANYSLVTEPGTFGNMVEIDRNGTSSDPAVFLSQTLPTGTWAAGDTLALSAHINITGNLSNYALKLLFRTATGTHAYIAIGAGPGMVSPTGFAYIEAAVPTGTTEADVQLVVPGGVGTIKLGQVTVTRSVP
jgi:lysophospholipase L1-like esterase